MKHQFALYVDKLSQDSSLLRSGSRFFIHDIDLIHRMMHVLRLKQLDEIILFDRIGHALVTIQEIDKKKVVCSIQNYLFNKVLEPSITVMLPLLKREAFEESIYAAVELGASVIQPITTEKTQRNWGGSKEKERVTRIMIAAAEQSKNFSLPLLNDPKSLQQVLAELVEHDDKVFFDPSGRPLLSLLNKVYETKPSTLTCLIGPEGDLSEHEKKQIQDNGFIFYALTPTVLRASQALNVGLGALRSI